MAAYIYIRVILVIRWPYNHKTCPPLSPDLEQISHYGHVGGVLVVHLVEVLEADAVELADGVE